MSVTVGADQLSSQAIHTYSNHSFNFTQQRSVNAQHTAIMLSSLTAFLPSALQLHQEPKELPPSPVPEEPVVQEEVTDAQPQVDSMPGAKKKGKKEKIANEVRRAMFHISCPEIVHSRIFDARHSFSFDHHQKCQIIPSISRCSLSHLHRVAIGWYQTLSQ